MANVSGWKDLEKQVAEALGGKRRFRTTESYGKIADDVMFPKAVRRSHPCVKTLAIECKKKKAITFTKDFLFSKVKYCHDNGKRLVFASKIPAPKNWKALQEKFAKLLKLSPKEMKRLRREHYIMTLVTVELPLFKELFEAWLEVNGE